MSKKTALWVSAYGNMAARIYLSWAGFTDLEKKSLTDWKDIGAVLPAKQITLELCPDFFISQWTMKPNCIITACISIVWFFCFNDPETLWAIHPAFVSSLTPGFFFWGGSRIITYVYFMYTHICRYIIQVLCVTWVLVYSSCMCLSSLVLSGVQKKKTGQNQWEAFHKLCCVRHIISIGI